jgi:hypothetical protein
MGRYKEGSRIAEVYEIFEKKGGQAAYDFGIKIVKVVTAKLWVQVWSKEKGIPNPVAHVKPPKDQEAHRTPREPKEKAKASRANGGGHVEQKERVQLPKPKPPKIKKEEGGPVTMQTKQLITVSYVKDKKANKAYLLEQGPQASLVRFAHNGTDQCIGNEWLGLPIVKNGEEEPRKVNRYIG